MKKLVIAVALGLVFNTGLIAGTIGGERPDRSPSWVGSFVNKIENLIIEKALQAYKTEQNLEKANSKKGWFSSKSEKDKVQCYLDEQLNELKNRLSSKPTNSKSDYVKKIVEKREDAIDDSNRPNNEVVELSFSLENINTIIKKYEERVQRNPSNYEIAIEYYEVYLMCLKSLIEMHQEFITSCETTYPEMIEKNVTRIKAQIADIDKELPQKKDEENINILKSSKEYLVTLLTALDEAKKTLVIQKKWAKDNLPSLEERRSTTETTLKTAQITKDVSGLVTGIKAKFESLQVSMPPLIMFKLDESKLKSH